MQREPAFILSHGQTEMGIVAVVGFFAISGFLITRSYERTPSAWDYVLARILRIMPGLIVVLFLMEAVLGPCMTRLPLDEYIAQRQPIRNFVLGYHFFIHDIQVMPGVFEHNHSNHINGSLWTLPYEAFCYGLVMLLAATGRFYRQVTVVLYLGCIAAVGLLENLYGGAFGPHIELPGPDRSLHMTSVFLGGALLYQYRIPLRAPWALLCTAIIALCFWLGNVNTALRLFAPYVVLYLCVGTRWRIPAPTVFGDLSYGTYIYAWPITQVTLALLPSLHNGLITACIVTPITLVFAYASWHLVEQRALALKKNRYSRYSTLDLSAAPALRSKLSVPSS